MLGGETCTAAVTFDADDEPRRHRADGRIAVSGGEPGRLRRLHTDGAEEVNSTEELFGKLVDGTPLIRLHTERPSTHVILTARPQLERLVLRCAPLGRVLR